MKFHKNFLVYWSVVYLLVAFGGRFASSKKEVFPFFRWSLYSKTPNTLHHAYILVEKIGDSALSKPTDIRYLFDYHHINSVDMNVIVQNFYEDVKKKGKYTESNIFKTLTEDSTFVLYETTIDLSIEAYENSKISNEILTFKNSNFYFE